MALKMNTVNPVSETMTRTTKPDDGETMFSRISKMVVGFYFMTSEASKAVRAFIWLEHLSSPYRIINSSSSKAFYAFCCHETATSRRTCLCSSVKQWCEKIFFAKSAFFNYRRKPSLRFSVVGSFRTSLRAESWISSFICSLKRNGTGFACVHGIYSTSKCLYIATAQ